MRYSLLGWMKSVVTRKKSLTLKFDVGHRVIEAKKTNPDKTYEITLQPTDNGTVALLWDGNPSTVEEVAEALLKPLLFNDNATSLRQYFLESQEPSDTLRVA